jgi:hypothetical protein
MHVKLTLGRYSWYTHDHGDAGQHRASFSKAERPSSVGPLRWNRTRTSQWLCRRGTGVSIAGEMSGTGSPRKGAKVLYQLRIPRTGFEEDATRTQPLQLLHRGTAMTRIQYLALSLPRKPTERRWLMFQTWAREDLQFRRSKDVHPRRGSVVLENAVLYIVSSRHIARGERRETGT